MSGRTKPGELAAFLAGEGDEGRGGVPVLPWSFAGMGFLIAWLCCTHLPGMFMYPVGGEAQTLADYLLRVGDIGTFLVVVVLGNRVGPVSSHPRICAALVAAGALGTLACPVLGEAGCLAPLAVASVAAGSGGAVLFLLWAQAYSQLGSTRCVFYGSLACIVAGASALLVSSLEQGASAVGIAVLPLLSGALAAVSLSRLPGEGASRRPLGPAAAGRIRYPVPWKLVALMALAGFCSGFAGALLVEVDGMGATHRIVATVAVGMALLALLFARHGELDIRLMARAALGLAVVSLVSIPFLGSTLGAALSFLVKLSYVSFALFVLLVLANVVNRHGIPSARVFASARAASEAFMFAGILLRREMRASGALDSSTMLWAIALIGLVAVVGCVLVWHSERSVTSDWGTAGVDPASGLVVRSERERLLERIADVAALTGLTPRECEILEHLAQGSDPAAVERALFLSHNTLKTHLRHIYAKLGVHTRAEAVALVAREA